jgi:hypothetical protein
LAAVEARRFRSKYPRTVPIWAANLPWSDELAFLEGPFLDPPVGFFTPPLPDRTTPSPGIGEEGLLVPRWDKAWYAVSLLLSDPAFDIMSVPEVSISSDIVVILV